MGAFFNTVADEAIIFGALLVLLWIFWRHIAGYINDLKIELADYKNELKECQRSRQELNKQHQAQISELKTQTAELRAIIGTYNRRD